MQDFNNWDPPKTRLPYRTLWLKAIYPLSQDWKCNIEVPGLLEGSLSLFWNRGLAKILAVLQCDEPSRSLIRNSGPIFLLRYRLSFICQLDQVSWSSSGILSTGTLFLRLWFSRNSILLSFISFNDLSMSQAHSQSQTLCPWLCDVFQNLSCNYKLYITKFYISRSKLRHYHNHHHQMVVFLD